MNPATSFASELIDTVADATTQETIGQTVPQDEKSEQRETYTGFVRDLPCLRNKGIVDTVLKELNWVQTHGDFLEAMKVIEPLVARVRKALTEAQILVDSRDPFAPLEFIESQSTRTVSMLQRLTAQERAQSQQIAVSFLGRMLPILGQKFWEVRGNAHRVGAWVFHGDHDFSTVSYGLQSSVWGETDVEKGIWNGAKLQHWSKWIELLKLCCEYKPGESIPLSLVRERLYAGEEWTTEEIDKRLAATLGNILMKFEQGNKPFERVRWEFIRISTASMGTSPNSSDTFALNQEFLDAPIHMEQGVVLKAPKISWKKLTAETVAELELSEDAQLVVKYFLSHADVESVQTSTFLTGIRKATEFILELPKILIEINAAFAKWGIATRIQKTGSTISITHS